MVTTIRSYRPGTSLTVLYVNGDGKPSERRIDIERQYTGRNGVTYLEAYCHLRSEVRTFRTDRILAVLETSAPAVPPGWASSVTKRLPTASPEHAASATIPAAMRPALQTTRAANARASPTAPHAPAPTRGSDPARTPPSRRSGVLRFLVFAGLAVGGAWVWYQGRQPEPYSLTRYAVAPVLPAPVVRAPAPAKEAAAVSPSAVQPSPAPLPDMDRTETYRGQTIRVTRAAGQTTWTHVISGREYHSANEMRIGLNSVLFSKETGIEDQRVFDLFAGADRNRDGEISWDEVQAFQDRINRSYRYELNDRALRPDEFLAAGGGDCEDWSLMAAGMLRFWGIPVYVGSLTSRSGVHAVALVPTTRLPRGARAIDVPEGGSLRPGQYVPIDYEHVGRLSNAVEGRYSINWIRTPESLYGMSI